MQLENPKADPAPNASEDASVASAAFPLSPTALGLRIRNLRRTQDLTVEALANAVGVHKTHLSRIERGLKAPSLTMMGNLAQALQVSIGQLVGEVIGEDAIVVNRASELGPRFTGDELHQFAPLLQGGRAGSFSAFVLYPGTTDGPAKAQHEGHELLYVLAGTVEIHFQDRTERLQPGDCVHFPGYLVHRVMRVGRAKAKALLVISAA